MELKTKLYDFTKDVSYLTKRSQKQIFSKIDLMLEEFMKKVYTQRKNTNCDSSRETTCSHDLSGKKQSTKSKLKQHIMRDHLPKGSKDQTTKKIKADEMSNLEFQLYAKKLCKGRPENPHTNINEIQTNDFVEQTFGTFQPTSTPQVVQTETKHTTLTSGLETTNTKTDNLQSPRFNELSLDLYDDSLIDLFDDHDLTIATKTPEESLYLSMTPTNIMDNNTQAQGQEGCLSPVSTTASMLESLLRKSECTSDVSILETSTESTSGLR